MLALEMEAESTLMEARFRALVAEWDLGRGQAAKLLGVEADALGLDLVPARRGADAEGRMRLLTEIRGLLPTLLPDARDVPLWLRGAFDEDGDGSTPLEFMGGGVAHLRALHQLLLARLG